MTTLPPNPAPCSVRPVRRSRAHGLFWMALAMLLLPQGGRSDTGNGYRLARELIEEQEFLSAAVEYRRLALAEASAERRAACYWAAAFAYHEAGLADRAARMLDQAEEESTALEIPSLLLRAESAIQRRAWNEASFYLESVASRSGEEEARRLAHLRLARVQLFQRRPEASLETLQGLPDPPPAAVEAVQTYARGRDKRPWLGGLLGIIPGAGYLYAGEPANALRSLILNGLFIWGLVDTAADDRWGAFSVIAFFEITWYSGSIYGGVDASHRYNRRRLERCVEAVDGSAGFAPDLNALPAVTLRFHF